MSYNLRSNKSQMEACLKMIVVLTVCWLLMGVRWTMLCRRSYRGRSWNSHAAVAQSYAADPPPAEEPSGTACQRQAEGHDPGYR